ncbi:CLUMA_CG009165, isoform A [Clunio marinus]|uniref:CLUMA_CG009165, isoform A n=1 Tax=Clunio marinus TaxID=568069 RepID=A0A1J1I804_9DIPT|nr:CLUMA_CG009165, isoform A [Clunio marinus]
MPFDQKRINGPESSLLYTQFIDNDNKFQGKNLYSKGKRVDGRERQEHRKHAFLLNTISKAKGSCYIENGNTKIICAVFELREIPRISKYSEKGQIYCDFKYAAFSRRMRKSNDENEEKLMSTNIRTALESTVCLHEFPNYQIDLYVMVLEDDGAVLATAINGSGLAFIDASIQCYGIITSTSASIINGEIFIDPTSEEERLKNDTNKSKSANLTLSSISSMDQIPQVFFHGLADLSLIKSAKEKILDTNKTHVLYFKKLLSNKIANVRA